MLPLSLIFAQADQEVVDSPVGEKMDMVNVISAREMSEKYEQLQKGDTLQVKFRAEVQVVCKNKGCWMKVYLAPGEEAMVKFKDYAFFVPKDIEGKKVIINGLAYVAELSVEERRHLAKDEGKSNGEIAAIQQPKITRSFMAKSVLIKE